MLNNSLQVKLKSRLEEGVPCVLTVNDIWDDFFDNPDSSIFDTQSARKAYTCNTTKDSRPTQTTGKKHNRVAALCIGVGGDEVVQSVYE